MTASFAIISYIYRSKKMVGDNTNRKEILHYTNSNVGLKVFIMVIGLEPLLGVTKIV